MATPSLTAQRLREMLNYDPDTGVFTRRVTTSSNAKAGDVAGCPNSKSYILICVDGRFYSAHRLAWFYMTGEWPTHQVDHINGVRNDNRWVNLRAATNSQNCQNRRMANVNNKCGLLGVSLDGSRWRSLIYIDGKKLHLGCFDTPELAHAAYLKAKAAMHHFQTLTETQ